MSPEEQPLSLLSSQLSAAISPCPPFTQRPFQQGQTSLEKGFDGPAKDLHSIKGTVSETLLQLAGQAPLC